ncbi:MAG TPA: DNRLRE domain-containing protein, partial [Candidatus Limnocylindrales bacterium]|nr:DNRLRE domain-containing protein [Candidatus Limnocylindrales bacterium]
RLHSRRTQQAANEGVRGIGMYTDSGTVNAISTSSSRRIRLSAAAFLLALTTALPMTVAHAAQPTASPSPSPTPTVQPSPEGTTKPKPKPSPTATPAPDPTPTPRATAQPELSEYAERVEAVIAAARQYIGHPYRVGSEGPVFIDCSGLVYRAFTDANEGNQIGVWRMRAAGYQRWFAGRELLTSDLEDVERGDLVVYNGGTHIGIYLGDGRVISALTSGVTVHSLNGITLPVTAYLAVDWNGKRGPFVPGVIPAPIDAPEEPASLVPPLAWSPEITDETLVAGPAIDGEERVDLRTANSRTWETDEGKFTTEFFGRPIHYLPADSTDWQPIDLRFSVPEDEDAGVAVASAAPVSLALREADSEDGLLTLSGSNAAGEELNVSLGLPHVGRNAEEPVLALDGSYADYRNALGRDRALRILPRADGFKTYLILPDRPASNEVAFAVEAGTLTLTPEPDGSVTLRDADGSIYGRVTRPMLLDSSDVEGDGGGVRASAVTLTVVPAADEESPDVLTLTIDRDLLAEAVYPAFVDLTLVDFPSNAAAAQHTFASSAHPDSNFSVFQRPEAPGYAELWHGRRPGRDDNNEIYLRFGGLADALRGATVESAGLAAFPYWQNAGDDPRSTWLAPITAEWDLRTLSWNTRPLPATEASDYETTQGQWTAMDLTAYTQSIVDGSALDYGLVLHASQQGRGYWKRFVGESTLGGGALEPRLTVAWSAPRPSSGQATFDETGTQVSLAWSHGTLVPDADRVQVQVSADGFATILTDTKLKGRHAGDLTLAIPTGDLEAATYSFRVRARYGEGAAWSSWSDAGTFTIAAPVPPAHLMDDSRFRQAV